LDSVDADAASEAADAHADPAVDPDDSLEKVAD